MTYLITINFNSSRYTIELLQSLEQVKTPYRLIIVDNQSTPDDFEILKKYVESKSSALYLSHNFDDFQFNHQVRIILIREEKNQGFAAGNNRGIQIARKQSDFEAVALINNDTEVYPNFLDEVLYFGKQNEKADIIGCRILFESPENVIWYDGGKFFKHSTRAVHINENKHISRIQTPKVPQRTGFITGCFMFITKHCLDTIGLLDETFFMYNEDLEYCVRATKNGLSLFYVPTSIIRHKIVPTSSPFATYWGARNRFKIAQLHSSLFDLIYTILFYLLTRIPTYTIWLFKGRIDLIKAQISGIIDGIKK